MYKSKLLLCAGGVVVDVQTNNVSVFNIVEEVTPPAFPGFIANLAVLHVLERDQDDAPSVKQTLRLTLGNQSIFEREFDVNFLDKIRARNIVVLMGLPIPAPGVLKVTFGSSDDSAPAQYDILVKALTTTAEISGP